MPRAPSRTVAPPAALEDLKAQALELRRESPTSQPRKRSRKPATPDGSALPGESPQAPARPSSGESAQSMQARAAEILSELERLYADARTELHHHTPFELLVSTVLSAQATDVSVNKATAVLFPEYPDAAALAGADVERVEEIIRHVGFHRAKARNIVRLSQLLQEKHGGEVPNDFEAIVALPGAGRKTANVVLSNAFGRPAIAVDTHVGRLSRRLGFTAHTDPDKVEAAIEPLFPREKWLFTHNALIFHGRRVCFARKPTCGGCTLRPLCPQVGVLEGGV